MKKNLLFVFLLAAVFCVNAQPWAYHPYGGKSAQPFSVPNATVFDATSIKLVFDANVVQAFQFDQVNPDAVPVWSAASEKGDIGRTIFEGTSTQAAGTWSQIARDSEEKTNTPDGAALPFMKWNGNPHAFESFIEATAFYTINFTEAGNYSFVIRIRGGVGATYEVSAYKKSDMGTAFQDLSFNSEGIAIADGALPEAGKKSTDESCEFVADAKVVNLGNPQSSTIWIKVNAKTMNVTEPGLYVVKVKQTGGANGNSFGGFTFFKNTTSQAGIYEQVKTTVYAFDKNLVVRLNGETANMRVFNTAGQLVLNREVNREFNESLPLNKGLYIVKIAGKNDNISTKVRLQ